MWFFFFSFFFHLCNFPRKERFPSIASLKELVSRALGHASALAVSLEMLLRLVDSLRHDYKSLLEWLLRGM